VTLCQQGNPLLLVVEDVNKASNPEALFEKLLRWQDSTSDKEGKKQDRWRLLCPVWPGILSNTEPRMRERAANASIAVGPYLRAEAVEALRVNSQDIDIDATDIQLGDIAEALGDDPLLIALRRSNSSHAAADVIGSYIDYNLRQAESSDALAADLQDALTALAERMIAERDLAPSWKTIKDWFATDALVQASLRKLIHQQQIVRLVPQGGEQVLGFRHDRVRDFLLSNAMLSLTCKGELPESIWPDPYFSDLFGSVLENLPEADLTKVQRLNPASLLSALKRADLGADVRDEVLKRTRDWMASAGFAKQQNQFQRYHAIELLAQTDGPYVRQLIEQFEDTHWGKIEAGLRNGDVRAGARLCYSSEPSGRHDIRDRLINHAVMKHPEFVRELAELIECPSITDDGLAGALNLAGEIGDPSLLPAIDTAWQRDPTTERINYCWIWAALRCFDGTHRELLDSLCSVWASLPEDDPEKEHSRPRWDLTGYSIPWALARKPNEFAIHYLLEKAEACPDLNWSITSILEKVDQPEAVIFIAQKMASIDHKIEGTDSFNVFANTGHAIWDAKDHGRRMSEASRIALSQIWQDQEQDKWLRVRAFGLWNQTLYNDELADLDGFDDDEALAEAVLRTRLQKGDKTAIPLLRKRLTSEEEWRERWWFNVRRVGLDELTDLVEETLSERRASKPKTPKDGDSDTDYILSELLMDRRNGYAEQVLLSHWDHLSASKRFVQAALYIATPELVERAHKVIKASDDPGIWFEHLSMHWGFKTVGRPGIVDQRQLEAIKPYIPTMDRMSVSAIFDSCNKLGLHVWRKEFVDPTYFNFERVEDVGSPEALASSLDRLIGRDNEPDPFLDFWLRDRQGEGHDATVLLELIADWAAAKGKEKHLRLLCTAMRLIGSRSNLPLLDKSGLPNSPRAKAMRSNCRYAVMRRTLN